MKSRPSKKTPEVVDAFVERIEPKLREFTGHDEIGKTLRRTIGAFQDQAFDHLTVLYLGGIKINDATATFYMNAWTAGTGTYLSMDACLTEAVKKWVIEEGVRIPCAEKQKAAFVHPDLSGIAYGECIAAFAAEARAVMKIVFPGGDVKHFWVPAEDIKKVEKDGKWIDVDPVRPFVGFTREAAPA